MSRVDSERRNKIFIRDGHRCVKCGSRDNLTVDHIKKICHGGKDGLYNLQTLCDRCHRIKDGHRLSISTVSKRNYDKSNLAMSAIRYGIAKNYKEAMKLVYTL